MQHERIRERISIDVTPEEHKKMMEMEEKELSMLMTSINPPLKELWDNEKDVAYDRI